MPYLYPGHNYLGPGNPLVNGPAVDKADEIARQHDYEYNDAQSSEDIYNSDQRAISSFARDFVLHPNLPSLAGATGLGIKHFVEKNFTGVVYPTGMKRNQFFRYAQANDKRRKLAVGRQATNRKQITPKKRTIIETPDTTPEKPGTSADANAADVADMEVDMPMADAPEPAVIGAATNSASNGMRGTVPLPVGVRQGQTTFLRTYKKQYQLRLSNDLNAYRTPTEQGVMYNEFIPPIHEIPVDFVSFYLNYAELQRLRQYTQVRVVEANCDVFNQTAILTFETNAQRTQIGNNNIGVTMVQLDPEIGKYRTGASRLLNVHQYVQEVFWGVDVNALPVSTTENTSMPGLSAMVERRNFNAKYGYRTTRAIVNRTENSVLASVVAAQQFFNVNRYVIKRHNISMEEGHFTSWSHKPKSGVIFSQNKGVFASGGMRGAIMNFADDRQQTIRTLNSSNTTIKGPVAGQPVTSTTNVIGNYYNEVFQNSQSYSYMLIDDPFVNPSNQNGAIPILAIGMDPQVAINSTTDALAKIDCHVDITLDVSITLEITQGTDYDDCNYGALQEINYKFPNYRTYRTDTPIGAPVIITGPQHLENPVDNDIHVSNSTAINNNIPITWGYPALPTKDDVEDDDKVLQASLKSYTQDERDPYFPYQNKAVKKLQKEQLDKEAKKQKAAKTKRSADENDDVSDEEELLKV